MCGVLRERGLGRGGVNGYTGGGGGVSGPSSPGETLLSEDRVKVRFGGECVVILDGEEWSGGDEEYQAEDVASGREGSGSPVPGGWSAQFTGVGAGVGRQGSVKPVTSTPRLGPVRKRARRRGSIDEAVEWVVKKGQWRVRIQPVASAVIGGGAGL